MNDTVLEVKNLRKLYPISRGIIGSLLRRPEQRVHAVDGISFSIKQGEILALVGESGSGKTTTGLCTLGLVEPTEGQILLQGEDVMELANGRSRKDLRRKAQIIFQDPYESLNPRQTVFRAVSEPLTVHKMASNKAEKVKMVTGGFRGCRAETAGLLPESLSPTAFRRAAAACRHRQCAGAEPFIPGGG